MLLKLITKEISLRHLLMPILVFFVSACTSSHEKLATYVGQDIQQVVAEFGYPNVAFDMGDGRRDFQWTVKMSTTRPAQAISRGAVTNPADLFDPELEMTRIAPMYRGQPVAAECYYTMITQWNDNSKLWIVTGYQKPRSGC